MRNDELLPLLDDWILRIDRRNEALVIAAIFLLLVPAVLFLGHDMVGGYSLLAAGWLIERVATMDRRLARKEMRAAGLRI